MKILIGKKYAIYLPKSVVEALGIKEGDEAILRLSGRTIIIEPLPDPVRLALSEDKFARIKPEDVEAISLEEQRKYFESTS